VGIGSENAAHRIAVTWNENGIPQQGVFIPRRDTSSKLNVLAGGRIFPGVHHHAQFHVREHGDDYKVAFDSDDGSAHVLVEGKISDHLPGNSIFGSIKEASDFFEAGAIGYSPGRDGAADGLELRTFDWQVQPLGVTRVESSFFDDPGTFPPGSAQFDCALLMRNIEHEWHARPGIGMGESNQRTLSERV
jgi:hypothetical protein